MKKFASLFLALSLALSLTACGEKKEEAKQSEIAPESQQTEETTKLTVFAAASLTESLNEIAEKYKSVAPNVELEFNFDSSGILKTQIEEGADCDLFIAASKEPMNQLDIAAGAEKNPDGLDLIDPDTRIDLLENKVVLAIPEGNPKGIESFDQLAQLLKSGDVLLAMGNSDVPVGQYTQKIFNFYGLNEEELASANVLTYCSNVKEVTSQVSAATVDCGVIYATDAFSADLEYVDTATEEMCGRAIYPAAVLKDAPHADEAKAFLDYLSTEDAAASFETVGFSMAQ